MGRVFKVYLGGPVYACNRCSSHLALKSDVISKSFQGRDGKAYLLHKCVNVTFGPREDRLLMTGIHTVMDIYCADCESLLGWKYEEAFEPSQKYKVGKYILEKERLHRISHID